ncbi:Ribonuclease H1 [Psilocybe cubensis]|uniref:Ribonuclease H1 n=2 Tax=Psilocybe cubensis TaxID=181762 RepID=A0ACB8HF34_PSICU|nr:Ribonuclease H1 [Psilocybe cubensis]KAH9486418.1 Ribonuclease H1 [Psilocybe cubensis]
MAPKGIGGYYAVRKGRIPGIYKTWPECKAQINEFPGAEHKKFSTLAEAEGFISEDSPSSSNAEAGPSNITTSHAPGDSTSKKRELDFGPQVDDVTGWDVVYSDGACKGNGKEGSYAGVGVWWGHNDPRNIAERCPGDQTNNRAELIAILRVLESTPQTKKPLLIRTDSQYSIQCFRTWINTWRNNNWKSSTGSDVKNAGIIRCISAHLDLRGKMGQKVVLEYVKGHSGDIGNDGADFMANQGAVKPRVDERPWEAIEKQLQRKLMEMPSDPHTPITKLTVLAPDKMVEGDDADLSESPAKMQKLSSTTSTPSKSIKSKGASLQSSLKACTHSTLATNQTSSPFHISPLFPPASSSVQSFSSPDKANKGKPALPSPQKSGPTKTKADPPSSNHTVAPYPHLSGAKSPMKVLCAVPPLVPVTTQEVNLDDYADCLLDDPSNDLSD